MRRLPPLFVLLLAFTVSVEAKQWRGILPLHSTRAEVEAPEKVIAIDGGYTEELTVSLYVLYRDFPPPPLTPTVDPSEVEIIYEKKRRPQKKTP